MALLAALALMRAAPGHTQAGGQCDTGPSANDVSIVVVASADRVNRYAASLRSVPILRRDAETIVFQDGRVVTSKVADVGRHLNALGWGHRNIQIVASLSRSRARRASPG